MTLARCWRWLATASLFVPITLSAQVIRGRVVDQGGRPLQGALVELRDFSAHSLKITLTSASGNFQLDAPAPGRYLYRVAAIGFQPFAPTELTVSAAGVVLADIALRPVAMRLPDIVALGRGKFCGKGGVADEVFERVLESAHAALQIMETTVSSRAIAFQVGIVNSRTLYGSFNNFVVSDTIVRQLEAWPILSIDPDTLRAVGFGRTLEPGDEATREYYGPDARVLFSDWFLDSHCFTLDKPKKGAVADSLHLRFAPARNGKLVDVAGELVFDAHNLALLQFSFTLRNLPSWMPDEASGGYMEFSPLRPGLWMTKTWAIWAPMAQLGMERRLSVGGQVETYGFVARVFSGSDTLVITHQR